MEAPLPKSSPTISAGGVNFEVWRIRSSKVTEFAGLLGTKSGGPNLKGLTSTARTKSLLKLLSNALEDHEVVITLPSLDLGLSESRDGAADPLPVIGEHREELTTTDAPRPTMAASVLTGATDGAANSEQKAAQNIGKLTSWTRSTLDYASDALKKNLSNSFASLVESRVRAWTLLLLRHSLSTGDDESRSRLLSMLSSTIKVTSADTKFTTLPLPDAAVAKAKEGEVILPLLFEATLHIALQESEEIVTLRAPGTITAQFDDRDSALYDIKRVAVRLTSAALLNSMVEQARMVVLKAVAYATKTSVPGNELSAVPSVMSTINENQVSSQAAGSLSGFRNALNLSTETPSAAAAAAADSESPRLQKARSSALRLNSVLHHKSPTDIPAGNLGIRKTRSVKWDTPIQPPRLGGALAPSPKKPKTINGAQLKSFKSFGRAHAEDFKAGPRNATFGEFERPQIWGRDGRLAYHPQPRQQGQGDFMGHTNVAANNATFDLGRPNRLMASSGQGNAVPVSLPRTTTALEMFVLKKSTSGGKTLTGGGGLR